MNTVKRFFLTLSLALLASVVAMAQVPCKFNYQTMVRDAQGALVSNQLVHVKISILASSSTGQVVYAEHSSAMADRSGWISIVVGEGVVMEGSLENVNWSAGTYYLRCDIDTRGGNNYAISSVQQMVSVPYALYAGSADYNSLSNRPDIEAIVRSVVQELATMRTVDGQSGGNAYGATPGMAEVAAQNNNVGYRQIKGVKDPTDPQDVVTMAYLEQYVRSMMRASGVPTSSYGSSAYETSSSGAAVQPVETFETAEPASVQKGALPGLFSVSNGKQVRFSRGNLQYSAMGSHAVLGGGRGQGTYRFAQNQSEVDPGDGADWQTLLVWGSTGCDDASAGTACNDWGRYNAIHNGGNEPGLWRLMTADEWKYLRESRPQAASKMALATLEGHTGLILLPDEWTLPSGSRFLAGSSRGFATNTYSTVQWSPMEAAGAVFLPAAGSRQGYSVMNIGVLGSYWTASTLKDGNVYSLDFSNTMTLITGNQPSLGQAVRLVQDK